MASPAVDFARSNQQRFLNELKDLLRIPSVSTLEQHKPDIKRAADYVAGELRRIGMENVEVIPTKGHPLIYADWLHASGKPTVLCYAHYDVQPAEPLDGAEDPLEEHRLSLVDAGHVGAERLHRGDDEGEEHDDLDDAGGAHENDSGLRSATKR